MPVASQWFAAPDTTYQISQSARFNDDDSAYLHRTPSSAGNRRTWTWSGWVKRGNLGSKYFFGAVNTGTDSIGFASTGLLTIGFNNANDGVLQTTRLFRDVGAWYHIVVAVDTTESTATNRIRLYVNGVEETDFATDTAPSLNYDTGVNNTVSNTVGSLSAPSGYFDGYLAEVHLVDGTQLTAASFGETDSTTGQWVPKAYTGSYGTNGFYLKFQDSSALGDDTSGNGNDFTSSGLAAADQMSDSPTNNFWTLNPFDSGATLSDGNLKNGGGSSTNTHAPALPETGKWYWEVVCTDINTGTTGAHFFGICDAAVHQGQSFSDHAAISAGQQRGGQLKKNDSNTSTGTAVNDGNTVGLAFDADNLTLKLYVEGSQSGSTITGLTAGTYKPWIQDGATVTNMTVNFGQSAFDQTVPDGYSSLCTNNLPDPTIADPKRYFGTLLYTGNGTTGQTVTGLETSSGTSWTPDWVWIKPRSAAYHSKLFDSVRTLGHSLESSTTAAQADLTGEFIGFADGGFQVDDNGSNNINQSGVTHVAWCWEANGSGGSNGDGSITSTVSADATSGFSIIRWTGTAANGTIGHGLGVQPSLYILKNTATTNSWIVGSTLYATTSYLVLNSTDALATGDAAVFNSTHPTSSVINLGSNVGTNGSSGANNMICYAFAEVEGFSKIGSYVGNGSSTAAPFIYTGFRPALVVVKNITNSGDAWPVADNARSPFNVANATVFWNQNTAETTGYSVDLLGNGFRPFSSDHGINESGATFLYAAWAETPFKTANAR
jgi:hypothetical protein